MSFEESERYFEGVREAAGEVGHLKARIALLEKPRTCSGCKALREGPREACPMLVAFMEQSGWRSPDDFGCTLWTERKGGEADA